MELIYWRENVGMRSGEDNSGVCKNKSQRFIQINKYYSVRSTTTSCFLNFKLSVVVQLYSEFGEINRTFIEISCVNTWLAKKEDWTSSFPPMKS